MRDLRTSLFSLMGTMLFPWLLAEPMMFDEGPANTALGLTIGALGTVLAPLTMLLPWFRPTLAWLGVALVVATFFLPEGLATVFIHLVVGVLLMVAGWAPGVKTFMAPAEAVDPARVVRDTLLPSREGPEVPTVRQPPLPSPA